MAVVAHASDGVIEINQASALAGGVNACDAPGFPVSICDSGSYRLTSNLMHGGVPALEIAVSDVNLDLNGMTVRGDNSCTTGPGGWVVSCLHEAFTFSIQANAPRVTVSNGRVIGSRGFGVFLSEASELRDVQVSDCGSDGAFLRNRSSASNVSAIGNRFSGIRCDLACSLSDVEATNNATTGIFVDGHARVVGAVLRQNGFAGLAGGNRVRVADIVATENGSLGISLGVNSSAKDVLAADNVSTGIVLAENSRASGIVANGNGGSGVVLGDYSSATGLTLAQNRVHGVELGFGSTLSGFTAAENFESGVRALDGSLVSDGALRDNALISASAFALQVQGGAGYRALVITKLGGGNGSTVSSGGVNLGNNTCQGGPCP